MFKFVAPSKVIWIASPSCRVFVTESPSVPARSINGVVVSEGDWQAVNKPASISTHAKIDQILPEYGELGLPSGLEGVVGDKVSIGD